MSSIADCAITAEPEGIFEWIGHKITGNTDHNSPAATPARKVAIHTGQTKPTPILTATITAHVFFILSVNPPQSVSFILNLFRSIAWDHMEMLAVLQTKKVYTFHDVADLILQGSKVAFLANGEDSVTLADVTGFDKRPLKNLLWKQRFGDNGRASPKLCGQPQP
ncbi:hypothetical protein BK138_35170 [Paenibacillus rhizosphaerae]|uniref:Uncharacterized protein n=1 Tax=Paenibacillus rhizosphaerae TaxID=297318 RepID=A0A1R1DWL0_9BACL|nr:hypothetical protein [Paenibacillus rhizosphaerae]OMF44004.1 hypothetical protein BK138_35170 [Paenibacillus rhizosphaerae]